MKLTATQCRPDAILPTRNLGDSGYDIYFNMNPSDKEGFKVPYPEGTPSELIYQEDSDLLSTSSKIQILPGETLLLGTGIILNLQQVFFMNTLPAVVLEDGFVPKLSWSNLTPFLLGVQVRSKSGLAGKQQLVVSNSPGTIDTSYTGECLILLSNIGQESRDIHHGQKIAQLVPELVPVFEMEWQDEPSDSLFSRGEGGFGSTGLRKE